MPWLSAGIWLRSFVLALTICVVPAQAKIVRLLDFDGTIVRDHGPFSTWRTYWILQRVDQLHSMMQPVAGLREAPETLQISFDEYLAYNRFLAKNGIINGFQSVLLERDPLRPNRPLSFVPGFYQVEDNLTFKYYRPSGQPNRNYILSDYREALARTKILNSEGETRYDWRGGAFSLFRAGLGKKESVGDTVIFSARWSYPSQLQQLVEQMRKDGFIANSVGKNFDGTKAYVRFHALSAPESLVFGRGGIGRKKVAVLTDEVRQLLWSASPKHRELAVGESAAKAGKFIEAHAIVVAEDDPRYVEDLRKAMENLSSDLYYSTKIKFVLVNTGAQDAIQSARWKWKYTVFDRGIGREALPEEIAFWEGGDECVRLLNEAGSEI